MAAITKLQDTQLLIGVVRPGYTVTAEDWENTMRAIRDAVNNNAIALNTNISAPAQVEIKVKGSSSKYSWSEKETGGYLCEIPLEDIGKTGIPRVHFYNANKEEVNCNCYVNQNNHAIVTSRVDYPITAIFM